MDGPTLGAPPGAPELKRAWDIQDRFGYSWWDSRIVAAALGQRCGWLLTEDLHDGQSIDGLTIVNPFAHTPLSILRSG